MSTLIRTAIFSVAPRTIIRGQLTAAPRRTLTQETGRTRRDVLSEMRSRAAPKQTLKERLMAPATDTAFTYGKALVAGASAMGIGALAFYGLNLSNAPGIIGQSMTWPQYVTDRVRSTFSYLGGTLAITAGSAYALARSPAVMNFMTRGSIWTMIGTLVAVIGTGMLCQSIPYENIAAKHMAWILHAAVIGGMIAPLTLLGGPLMMRAAIYTAGIVGGLSTVAACAPSDKFLAMGGPLAIGLGVVFAASIASMFLPPTTAVGAGLYSVVMYGGLVLFSAFLLYDTQRVIRKAEIQPPMMRWDPINAMIHIYMDIMNIFIRVVMLVGGNRRR